ncbi:hypothetical protein JXA47_14635 [Candidatus Sumerlaeota bacterium]|nr:hypothetical protein [Candidatus Sumerlaeota bacterium]
MVRKSLLLVLMSTVVSGLPAPAQVLDSETAVIEAERRIELFQDDYRIPIESAVLALELTTTRTPSESEVDLHLSHYEGYETMGREERNRFRRAVQEQMNQPSESRVLLHFESPDLYRLQMTQSVVSLGHRGEFDEENVSIDENDWLTIQGESETWRVFEATRMAALQAERLTIQSAWGGQGRSGLGLIETFYFGSTGFSERLSALSQLVTVAHEGEEVIVSAQVPEVPDARVFLGFRPQSAASRHLDWALSVVPGDEGFASMTRFEDWTESNGVYRPQRVTESTWRDMAISPPPDLNRLMQTPPTSRTELVALSMEFNSEIDPEVFTYNPPDDYTAYRENPGGEPIILQQRFGDVEPDSRRTTPDLPEPVEQPRQTVVPRPSLIAMALGVVFLVCAVGLGVLSRKSREGD